MSTISPPQNPIFINTQTLKETLTYKTLIHHFQISLPKLSPTNFHSPLRHSHVITPPPSAASLLLMPSWSTSPSLPYIGVKLLTSFPNNSSSLNLPGVHATYNLFSSVTGQTLASMDGTELTRIRTACVSALASQYLSVPNPQTLIMIGAGSLAPHLIKAHLITRPELSRIIIWNRTHSKALDMETDLRKDSDQMLQNVEIECWNGCLDEVIGLGDIICCATNSEVALVKGELLKRGAHLDLVGSFTESMRECDDEALRKGRVFVDCEGALVEAGELIGGFARGVISKEEIGKLDQLCSGERDGRRDGEEITVFKSVGSAVVDILAAQLVYETYIKNLQ